MKKKKIFLPSNVSREPLLMPVLSYSPHLAWKLMRYNGLISDLPHKTTSAG